MSIRVAVVAIALAVLIVGLGDYHANDADAATTIVMVGQRADGSNAAEFNLNTIGITENDTVQWDYFDGTHNVVPFDAANWGTEIADGGNSATPGTSLTFFNAPATTYSVNYGVGTAGTVWYLCTLHAAIDDIDTNGDGVVDGSDSPNFGKMIGRIDIAAAPVDSTGPIASAVLAVPSPTNGAASVLLTATVDDSTTGGSAIQAAEYFIDVLGTNGTGTPLAAADGAFNTAIENVTANVNVSGLSLGVHNIFVQG